MIKGFFIYLIKIYQKSISPRILSSCRFRPTCSNYAIEALEKHGVFKGLALAFCRILRCNPFCKGGFDPVPEPRRKKQL